MERQRRELEEAEVERLAREKEKLEEETRMEQRRVVTLQGSERAAERCWRRHCQRLAQVGHLLKNQNGP